MCRDNRKALFILFSAGMSVVMAALLLINSEQAANAVRKGIEMCCASVIPSLFPMMFLSQYIITSGAAELAGKSLDRPVSFLFGLPGVCGVALLTAFVGGYPAGVRAAGALVQSGRITPSQGEKLAGIAFCAGPGFTIGLIGGNLYNNKTVGLLILTAQAFSCIIIGTVQNIITGRADFSSDQRPDCSENTSGRTDAFVRSASDTAATMLNMCSFIVLFQVILSMLDAAGVNTFIGRLTELIGFGDFGNDLLACISEVTAGSMISVKYGLPLTAFVVGFGGLCVHFQNFAVCGQLHLRKSVYFFCRLVQGALCAAFVALALKLPCLAYVSRPASKVFVSGLPAGFSAVSGGFGCAMLVMCLMSVICLPQSQKELNNK